MVVVMVMIVMVEEVYGDDGSGDGCGDGGDSGNNMVVM